jgi:hypothetical protein
MHLKSISSSKPSDQPNVNQSQPTQPTQTKDPQPKPSLFQLLTRRIYSATPAITAAGPVGPRVVPLTAGQVAFGLHRLSSESDIPMDTLLDAIGQVVCKGNVCTEVASSAGPIIISHVEDVGAAIFFDNNCYTIKPEILKNLGEITRPPMFNSHSPIPTALEVEFGSFLSVKDQAKSARTSKGFHLSLYRKKAPDSVRRVDNQIRLAQKQAGKKFSRASLASQGNSIIGIRRLPATVAVKFDGNAPTWLLSYHGGPEGTTHVTLTESGKETVIPAADFRLWVKYVHGDV